MIFCDEILCENRKIQQFLWQNIYVGGYLLKLQLYTIQCRAFITGK